MRCRYRLSYICLCSSAGSTGTSLASQSSRLNNASFCCLPASIFSFCFIFFQKKSLLFQNFALFFRDVRAHCPRASAANTSQQGAISSAQSSKASTWRPERDNASKQTEWVVEHLHSSLRSQDERRHRNILGKNVPPLTKQPKLEWFMKDSPLFPISVRYSTVLSPSFVCISCMHAASELFPGAWSSWIYASRQFAPKSWTFLSASFFRI